MDTRFIVMWAGFLAVFGAGLFFSKHMNKQIKENGIEATGTITRLIDMGDADTIDIQVYAHYLTEDGEEIEGLLVNAPDDLEPGQRICLKYHPKLKQNARFIELLKGKEI